MGGNIKFFSKTRRYDRQEYLELEAEVIKTLWENIFAFDYFVHRVKDNIQALRAYDSKESFGDCDIIVNSRLLKPNYIDYVVIAFRLRVGDWSKMGMYYLLLIKIFKLI